MAKQYKCSNYGICPEADKETIFQEMDLEEVDGKYVCPKCGQELEVIEKGGGGKGKLIGIIAAAVVVLGGGAAALLLGGKGDKETTTTPPATEEVTSQPRDVAVTSVQLDQTEITMEEGKAIALVAIVLPEDATHPEVSWSSSDPAVVSVNERGELQLLKKGTATITATADGVSATCPVTVKAPTVSGGNSTTPSYPTVGTFSGPKKNGYPNGQGTLTFTQSRKIDTHDEKGRVADKGDYIIGEWENGHLIQGKWFDAQGNPKGSIVIGKAPNAEADHNLGKVK